MKYLIKGEMQLNRAYPASDLLKYILYWWRGRKHFGSEKDRLDHLIAESSEFENRQEAVKLLVMLNVMDFNVTLWEKTILDKYFQVEQMARPYNQAINANSLDKKHDENAKNMKNFDWSSMFGASKNYSNAENPNDKIITKISTKNKHQFKRKNKKVSKEQPELSKSMKSAYQQLIGIHEEEKVQNLSKIEEQQEQKELPSPVKNDGRRVVRQLEEIEEDASFDDYE
jgi:hypothetical protein